MKKLFVVVFLICAFRTEAQYLRPVDGQESFWFTNCQSYRNASPDSEGFAVMTKSNEMERMIIFNDYPVAANEPVIYTVYGKGFLSQHNLYFMAIQDISPFANHVQSGFPETRLDIRTVYNDTEISKICVLPFAYKNFALMRISSFGYKDFNGDLHGVKIDNDPDVYIKKVSVRKLYQHQKVGKVFFPHIGDVEITGAQKIIK